MAAHRRASLIPPSRFANEVVDEIGALGSAISEKSRDERVWAGFANARACFGF